MTLHETDSELLHFARVGPEICKFVSAVAKTKKGSAPVSVFGSAGSAGTQNVDTPVVGIMIDASAGILECAYGRNGFVESWLRAERPGELNEKNSGFLSAAGLPQHAGFNSDSYLLGLFGSVGGVRHAKLKTKLAYGMKQETCTATLFFVFATDTPVASTSRDVVVAHHVASVKAGFDAMIREGVSVAAIDVHYFSRGGGTMNTTSIVKTALGGIVPGSASATGLGRTYADYIPTVAVVGYAENWNQGFGRPEAELYTP